MVWSKGVRSCFRSWFEVDPVSNDYNWETVEIAV